MMQDAVFPMESSLSSKLAFIRQSHCILLPLQKEKIPMLFSSPSLQRKTLICACQKGVAQRLPSSFGLLSLTMSQKGNPLFPAQVDWLSLNDEEFEKSMEAISSDFGPDCSKMVVEKLKEYCKRRGKYVAACSKQLFELVGHVDLMTPWKKSISAFDASACSSEDFVEVALPAVQESFDKAYKSRASNHQVDV